MAKNKNLDVIYIIRCIFICISFCTYNDVKAQHMVARPIPFFYQLYSNEVFDIYQDRTGYLWFGMTSGMMVIVYIHLDLIINIQIYCLIIVLYILQIMIVMCG